MVPGSRTSSNKFVPCQVSISAEGKSGSATMSLSVCTLKNRILLETRKEFALLNILLSLNQQTSMSNLPRKGSLGHGLPFMEHGLDKQWRRIEEPIRSQAQEPRQIIQNQEMYWLKAATVSMEDIGGRSTEGTFNTIQKMELESSAIVNSGTK
ncbi:hypothetical protein NC652_015386 [Populus alba x Populus x berolinensis]|nr:hypothetical protein NC652_015386 [Populus alba x Populus x berolinensis]